MNQKDKGDQNIFKKFGFTDEAVTKYLAVNDRPVDELLEYLNYIEEYSDKKVKTVTLVMTEYQERNLKKKVPIDYSNVTHPININYQNTAIRKLLSGIRELPWDHFHYYPWQEIVINDIYYCFGYNVFGRNLLHIQASDFTIANREGKIIKDKRTLPVYYCSTVVLLEGEELYFGEQAFWHSSLKDYYGICTPFAYQNTKLIEDKISTSATFPTHFRIIPNFFKEDQKTKVQKIKKYIGFPKDGHFVD